MVDDEVKSPNYPSPETPFSDDILRQTIVEISSLISLTHTITIFTLKWQIIRSKLDQLNSNLITTQNNHHKSTIVDPLHDVITTVVSTLEECRDLAGKCINDNFSGKLLMQSDLDLLISKFDTQLKEISLFYNNVGIISDGFALIVLKPGSGANRDDMRFYVKDLLNRVKIGDMVMKCEALVCVNEILTQDERYVKVVVEMDDFVFQLSSFLTSNDVVIQEESSFAIRVILGYDKYKGLLVNSGVVSSLIRLVESGRTVKGRQNAVLCLERLTQGGDNAWAVSAHGGVTCLLGICCSSDESGFELVTFACWVLRNLVVVDEIKRFMIEQGVIQCFIKLIRCKDEMILIGSCEFIQTICSCDDSVRHLVVKDGGVHGLVRILDPLTSFSFKSRETALRAIENLCYSRFDYVDLITSYGLLDHLLHFLRKGDVSMQELAFKSSTRLCITSEETRKTMGDVGFMTEFVKFLEGKSYEIREMAAEALSSLMTVPKNRKKFSQEDHNIVTVLKMLETKDGNFKFILSILLSLSNCNNGRRRIASSEYVKNIEKLADSGVSDAKKIVRKLSTNRFRSMLNVIWHS